MIRILREGRVLERSCVTIRTESETTCTRSNTNIQECDMNQTNCSKGHPIYTLSSFLGTLCHVMLPPSG